MAPVSPWSAFRATLLPGDQQLLDALVARRQGEDSSFQPMEWGWEEIAASISALIQNSAGADSPTNPREISLLGRAFSFFDEYVPPPEEGRTVIPGLSLLLVRTPRWGLDLRLPKVTFDDPRQGGRGLGFEGGRRPVGSVLERARQDFAAKVDSDPRSRLRRAAAYRWVGDSEGTRILRELKKVVDDELFDRDAAIRTNCPVLADALEVIEIQAYHPDAAKPGSEAFGDLLLYLDIALDRVQVHHLASETAQALRRLRDRLQALGAGSS